MDDENVVCDLDHWKASYDNPVYLFYLREWFSDPSPDKTFCCCYPKSLHLRTHGIFPPSEPSVVSDVVHREKVDNESPNRNGDRVSGDVVLDDES